MIIGSLASAIESAFVFPNASIAFFRNEITNEVKPGVASRFMYVGDFDLNAGAVDSMMICSLSYDIKNLEKLGLNVKYTWDNTFIKLGMWGGYNFTTNTGAWGEMLLCLQIGLK